MASSNSKRVFNSPKARSNASAYAALRTGECCPITTALYFMKANGANPSGPLLLTAMLPLQPSSGFSILLRLEANQFPAIRAAHHVPAKVRMHGWRLQIRTRPLSDEL